MILNYFVFMHAQVNLLPVLKLYMHAVGGYWKHSLIKSAKKVPSAIDNANKHITIAIPIIILIIVLRLLNGGLIFRIGSNNLTLVKRIKKIPPKTKVKNIGNSMAI